MAIHLEGHQIDMCYVEIGLCAKNQDIGLKSQLLVVVAICFLNIYWVPKINIIKFEVAHLIALHIETPTSTPNQQ